MARGTAGAQIKATYGLTPPRMYTAGRGHTMDVATPTATRQLEVLKWSSIADGLNLDRIASELNNLDDADTMMAKLSTACML